LFFLFVEIYFNYFVFFIELELVYRFEEFIMLSWALMLHQDFNGQYSFYVLLEILWLPVDKSKNVVIPLLLCTRFHVNRKSNSFIFYSILLFNCFLFWLIWDNLEFFFLTLHLKIIACVHFFFKKQLEIGISPKSCFCFLLFNITFVFYC